MKHKNNIKILLLILCLYNLYLFKTKTILKNATSTKESFLKINYDNLTYQLNISSENPLISIILDFAIYNKINHKSSNFLSYFLNQTFIGIQAIVLKYPFPSLKNESNIKFQIFDNNIKISRLERKLKIDSILDVVNKLDGKYVIYIDKYIELINEDIYKIYNILKGTIKNIFKYYNNNKNFIYIIRTKILRNIIDSKSLFQNYEDLINYIYSYESPKLNYIPIALCPDNKYTPLAYTAMISILNSKSSYTYILFFLIISKDFLQYNIQLIESLYEQFDYFNITFIKMDDRYRKAVTFSSVYHYFFRFSISELIPNMNKIIYLDSDIVCFTDLADLYNLNFKGKMILGQILSKNKSRKTGYYSINSGVLLLDLREMRKIKFEKKILNILKSGIKLMDQEILNKYFGEYIGIFPPKYNTYLFNYNELFLFNNGSGNIYNFDDIYFAFKFPSIRHFVGPKKNIYNQKEWIYFARKSKYFQKLTSNLSNFMT